MGMNFNEYVVEFYIDHKKNFKEYCDNLSLIKKELENQNITLERVAEITDWFLDFIHVINKLCASLYHFSTGEDLKKYNPTLYRDFNVLQCADYSQSLQDGLNRLLEQVDQFCKLPYMKDPEYCYLYFKLLRKELEFFSVGSSPEEFIRLRNSIWNEIQYILSNIICANCKDNADSIIRGLNTITFLPKNPNKSAKRLFK